MILNWLFLAPGRFVFQLDFFARRRHPWPVPRVQGRHSISEVGMALSAPQGQTLSETTECKRRESFIWICIPISNRLCTHGASRPGQASPGHFYCSEVDTYLLSFLFQVTSQLVIFSSLHWRFKLEKSF